MVGLTVFRGRAFEPSALLAHHRSAALVGARMEQPCQHGPFARKASAIPRIAARVIGVAHAPGYVQVEVSKQAA